MTRRTTAPVRKGAWQVRRIAVVLDVAGVIALLVGIGALLWDAAFSRSLEGHINHFWGLRFFKGSIIALTTLSHQGLSEEWRGYTFYMVSNRVVIVGVGFALLIASSALRRLAGSEVK
jgi:hypothetical protein